ncbi:MAG: YeeE/YedE family protein [Acidobacteriota bacterium]
MLTVSAMAQALAGGVLIGTSASLLLWTTGRIAGISNMTHGLFASLRAGLNAEAAWRAVFLLGMVLGATACFQWGSGAFVPRPNLSAWVLVVGGLLVGFGTSLGNGCTSGHGVCGLGRRSARSLMATLTFMVTGGITVWVMRHAFAL